MDEHGNLLASDYRSYAIPTARAIANAIFNAVGVRIKDLPITAEKVLKALAEQEAERQPKVSYCA